ncbi:hypothetical protein AHAT_36400 [Agarivorans sp. Toyoura001]|uniref:hypothetical protein n=1 Tax=Agarivorans sp. Toyoura001 TaxID=2283141 RepID=UPI0010E0438F|nr:hypothetical protein [Agarivorans sp. Toyoura001]GDY27750.1 hypothetical protein AHAT_36400 [Agarivorans sp. Toyoura001]
MIVQINRLLNQFLKMSLVTSLLLLTACIDEEEEVSPVPNSDAAVQVKNLRLQEGTTELAVGDSSQLVVNADYNNGTTKPLPKSGLIWRCEGFAVDISSSSEVSAVKAGESNCIVSFSMLQLAVDFVVAANDNPTSPGEGDTTSPSDVRKLRLGAGETSLKEGDTSQLVVNGVYADNSTTPIANSELVWQCDSPAVNISATSFLSAYKAGESICKVSWNALTLSVNFVVTASEVLPDFISTIPQGHLILPLATKQDIKLTGYFSNGTSESEPSDATLSCDTSNVSLSAENVLTTESVGQATCTATWKEKTAQLLVTVVDSAATQRKLSLAFLDHLRFSDEDYSKFTAWVDKAVEGKPGYGFSPTDAIYMYYLTQDKKYIDLAIADVEAQVVAAEAKMAANEKPAVSADSYLHVGNYISKLAYAYDYGYELLSESQRKRWENYAEQAIWNVWNHKDAEWAGNSFSWSGWATTNPGNNYHFSFLKATITWGVVTQNDTWLNLLSNDKLPKLVAYYDQFEKGGSREGTGYGVAQRDLFELYQIWKDSSGEDLSAQSVHSKETIDYWIHATTPPLEMFAPIGDQSRVSKPKLFDYHENLIHRAASLNIGTDEAKRGKWWLDNNSVNPIVYGFNLDTTLLQQELNQLKPTELVYHATGAGHLFVRSSWETDATWLSAVAGIYDESHAHRDQGSFSLYKDDWLAVTQNIWSHSGIHQESEVHNMVRFVEDGETILQKRRTEATMDYTVNGAETIINMDLSQIYAAYDSVTSWQRKINFTANRVLVSDQCVVADSVSAIWQINLPVEPIVNNDGTITAGNLLITPIAPANPSLNIVNWQDVNEKEYKDPHYKLELQGAGCNYQVQLDVLN